ncbi:AMP-binding protein [Flagellimonas meishanensis]|uniref:AMP-binding protein n=1 Tax=Flagellimonas meishanensis TaxID=2873264 RepID=UPI001CA74977|nr:AMP-binding protein [[Muricauda] meishanensis]
MNSPTWLDVHPSFKLNGIHYSAMDLGEVGYSLIKEGEPFEMAIGEFLLDWISPNEHIDVFTSGSTGKPKSIPIKKVWMMESARATGTYFHLGPGTKALLCLSCSSIAGKMMLVRSMVLGWQLDYVEPSIDPLSLITKEYDFTALVPLQAQNSLEKLPKIKKLIIGGAPIGDRLKKELLGLPTEVYETYGMTETISHVAIKDLRKNKDGFHALPDISFEQDKRTCLIIHAPKRSPHPIVTNDLVELHDETHFKWLGRYDSIINSGGIKLIPEQIEKKLATIIHARFFVAGIEDEALGQRLILVVEDPKCNKDKLFHQIRALQALDKYEVPKDIFCLDLFIETSTGKIQRDKTLSLIV